MAASSSDTTPLFKDSPVADAQILHFPAALRGTTEACVVLDAETSDTFEIFDCDAYRRGELDNWRSFGESSFRLSEKTTQREGRLGGRQAPPAGQRLAVVPPSF